MVPRCAPRVQACEPYRRGRPRNYPAGGVREGSAHQRTWAPPASTSASSEPRANATLFAVFMAPPFPDIRWAEHRGPR